ncbi:MAG: hypothetical protein ABQ298_02420 [Puniceicoccaceae bacterium]
MGNLSQQKAEILDRVGADNPYLDDDGSVMDAFHAADEKAELQALQMALGGKISPDQTAYAVISKVSEGLLNGGGKDKKDKKDDHTTYLLLQLQQINREIEYLQMERDDLMELRDLIENGEFDQQNPEHMELIERLGIDPDEFFAMSKEEQLQVLDGRIEENTNNLRDKAAARDALDPEQRNSIQAQGAEIEEKQVADQDYDDNKQLGRVARDIEDDGLSAVVQELDDFERERGELMKKPLPEAMKTGMEKKLFAGLSDEAKSNLPRDGEYEHLFESEEQKSNAIMASRQTPEEDVQMPGVASAPTPVV